MAVTLNNPFDRPGYSYGGTSHWVYASFRDATNYNPRVVGSVPSPIFAFKFYGWATEAAFENEGIPPNDEYEIQLSLVQFIPLFAPVLQLGPSGFIRALEQVLVTKPGFTSGVISS